MRLRSGVLLIAAVMAFLPSTAPAQSILDRVVGQAGERPLVITQLTGQVVGQFAVAAGVPAGIEVAPGATGLIEPVQATGRTVREVADAIVSADTRYAWREDDGVLVFRPRAAWDGGASSLLDKRVGGLHIRDIEASYALPLVAQLFGITTPTVGGPADTRRFSVDVQPGSTRLDALNAIVRAHGTLAWALEPGRQSTRRDFPFSALLLIGSSGTGFGIPRSAVTRPSSTDLEVAMVPSPGRRDDVALLDRVVQPQRDGAPLVVFGMSGLPSLGAAVGVPMVVQTLAPELPRVKTVAGVIGLTMTGLTLRVAMDLLQGTDPRYEWREMNGVIIVRPREAWSDPGDALFRPLPGLQFHDVPTDQALGRLSAHLGGQNAGDVTDTRPISVDVPSGSILDVLTAVAKAHGELTLEWSQLDEREQRASGNRYRLRWFLSGYGNGWTLP